MVRSSVPTSPATCVHVPSKCGAIARNSPAAFSSHTTHAATRVTTRAAPRTNRIHIGRHHSTKRVAIARTGREALVGGMDEPLPEPPLAGECNGCGACCRVLTLPQSPEEIQNI